MNSQVLISLLKKQSFDSGRYDILKELSKSISTIDCDSLTSLLKCYSFDSGRTDAIELLKHKISIDSHFDRLFGTMSYDSGRISMLMTICNIKFVPFDFIDSIFGYMSFDAGKKEVVHILSKQAVVGDGRLNIYEHSLPTLHKLSSVLDINDFEIVARNMGFCTTEIENEKARMLEEKKQKNSGLRTITINGATITYELGVSQTINIGKGTIEISEDGSVSLSQCH